MKDSVIRMAIVGAGTWGEAHAGVCGEHPSVETVAVCDLDRPRAEAFAARYGIPEVYADHRDMLKHCGCDAVAVVTPDHLHAAVAVDCANAGKHMIIEKPLATTRADVFNMLEAIERGGARAMVDLHNRWNPPFNAVKQLVDSGRYGRPTAAHIRLTDCLWVATDLLPWTAKTSILWFLGSHSLDTVSWIVGEYPEEVYAVKTEGQLKALGIDAADSYFATLKYPCGAVAHMENSWVTPNGNSNPNDFKFHLLCTEGKFDIDASSHSLLQVTDRERMVTHDVLVRNLVFGSRRGFAFESIRSFLDCLLSGEPFHISLREAASVSLSLLAVMESAEKGVPVRVERV